MTHRFLLISLAFVLAFPGRGRAARIESRNFDIDDNILTTGAHVGLRSTQDHHEVLVSTANWALVRQLLGKAGPWQFFEMAPGGLADFNDEGPKGTKLFLDQVKDAFTRGHWRAPSWGAFAAAMADPHLRPWATLITARGHAPESIREGFAWLTGKKVLVTAPLRENIYPVLWKGLPDAYRGSNSSQSKAKVMQAVLDKLEAEPVSPTEKHLWTFSDDDFGNFSTAAHDLAPEVARGRWPHVKIELIFTGLNHPTERPRCVVIRPDATLSEGCGEGSH